MEPNEAVWKLGENRHGQPFELRMRVDYLTKQKEYAIHREMVSQRDNTETVNNIPIEILRKLAAVINELK